MTDDITRAHNERMAKLSLLQQLFNILLRNSYEAVDTVLRQAIERDFKGKLELLIEFDTAGYQGWRRRDFTVSFRLLSPEQRVRTNAITFDVDPATLRDMYERMAQPEPEAPTTDGPVDNVTVFDCSAPTATEESDGEVDG